MLPFLKTAFRHYATVGAVVEISQYVAQKVLREINPCATRIVEYGAGNGVLTRGILKQLPSEGKLVAVEMLQEFAVDLRRIRDPRLTVIMGDVAEVLQRPRVFPFSAIDVAVSNIPFSLMPEEKRIRIIARTSELIAPGGAFLIYQNLPVVALQLKRYFPAITWRFEFRNLPPYFIMAGRKC